VSSQAVSIRSKDHREDMGRISSFRELDVYQRALDHAQSIYEWSLHLPKEERYGLSSQIRRSSRAVGALIAEAWARRRYQRAFTEKLTQALAEAKETQSWLDHARSSGHLETDRFEQFDDAWDHVCAMIRRMIQRADRFCNTG
jgi:four helix bundle protein